MTEQKGSCTECGRIALLTTLAATGGYCRVCRPPPPTQAEPPSPERAPIVQATMADRMQRYNARARAIAKRFTKEVPRLGFTRSKKNLFVAKDDAWAFWISQVVPRYPGRAFELEWGVRVFNSSFPGLHLNGERDPYGAQKPFNMWFVDSDKAETECVNNMLGLVEKIIIPWKQRFSSADSLLAADSPLRVEDRAALQRHLAGEVDTEAIAESRKLLFGS